LAFKRTNLDAYAILYKPTALTAGENGPLHTGMTFTELVNALEQALISSFKPIKNKNSLNFPNDFSTPAKQLINMGISNIHLTVESPIDYGKIYTDHVESESKHRFDIKLPKI
jgi:hypothetical protein